MVRKTGRRATKYEGKLENNWDDDIKKEIWSENYTQVIR